MLCLFPLASLAQVRELIGNASAIGIHCHNDGGLAVANSLSAVRGGALMVQGCMNGCAVGRRRVLEPEYPVLHTNTALLVPSSQISVIHRPNNFFLAPRSSFLSRYGERTGNADLIAIAGDLETKMGRRCLPDGGLHKLTAVSKAVAAACRIPHSPSQPYAGAGAFAHKGGLHVAALRKMPTAYNHIDPTSVGNEARTVVSELSGRGNVHDAAVAAGLPPLSDAVAAAVLGQIKALENAGAAFEAAPASVEMLIARCSELYEAPFHVREFNVVCSNRSFAAAGDAPGGAAGSAAEGSAAAGRMTPGATAGYKQGSESVNTAWVKVELPTGEVALQVRFSGLWRSLRNA